MSAVQLSRKEKMLVHCAPIREERVDDRALRMALHRARKTEAFAIQQDFDKAATALVQAIPIPQEITDWIPTDTFIAPARRDWKKYAQNPAFLATGIAVLVIAVVAIYPRRVTLALWERSPRGRRKTRSAPALPLLFSNAG